MNPNFLLSLIKDKFYPNLNFFEKQLFPCSRSKSLRSVLVFLIYYSIAYLEIYLKPIFSGVIHAQAKVDINYIHSVNYFDRIIYHSISYG